ncbi:hypothetical protein [Paraburkholderia sp. HD33-4]|uniref:hypothetical protein n=1 Tax=Paraburkholderia sp. HD33-4 TaxID=2883242 RepID=UPI001F1AB763|nr:hypothetical protein [Paraburkholderia sp. HD33-4]
MSNTKPWESEPDYAMFSAAGLTCVIRRSDGLGHLCGYVGVPASHPLYGVDRLDLVPAPDTWLTRTFDMNEHGVLDVFAFALEQSAGEKVPQGFAPLNMLIGAHGGLTWSKRMHDHTGWWFGFDCGHAGDLQPQLVESLRLIGGDAQFALDHFVYRTFDYVRGECATLAQQIADWTEHIPHIQAAKQAIATAREVRLHADH